MHRPRADTIVDLRAAVEAVSWRQAFGATLQIRYKGLRYTTVQDGTLVV